MVSLLLYLASGSDRKAFWLSVVFICHLVSTKCLSRFCSSLSLLHLLRPNFLSITLFVSSILEVLDLYPVQNKSTAMAWTFYYYAPSTAAATIFTVLFGLSSLTHCYQLVRTRTWFMIPFLIGGLSKITHKSTRLIRAQSLIFFNYLVETIGYIGRLLSSLETPDFTRGPYIMQSTLILIAPAFLAASIYMTLGRVIHMLHAEESSLIKLKWLTKIFVTGDVLSFLMQASGKSFKSIVYVTLSSLYYRCGNYGPKFHQSVYRRTCHHRGSFRTDYILRFLHSYCHCVPNP